MDNQASEKVVKILANCGFGSRRVCEELIDMMRVTLDGNLVQRGDRATSGADLRVDGSRVKAPKKLYYKIHKPRGTVCTDSVKHGEKRLVDLLPPTRSRMYAVGRLDKDYEGLMLFTNDGEMCNRLTHPRYRTRKIYEVKIRGFVPDSVIAKVARGIHLSEGKTAPLEIRTKARSERRTLLTMVIFENRRRLIPRLFASLDQHVERVRRIGVGPIRMKGLAPGQAARLNSSEVKALEQILSGETDKPVFRRRGARYNRPSNRSNRRKKS